MRSLHLVLALVTGCSSSAPLDGSVADAGVEASVDASIDAPDGVRCASFTERELCAGGACTIEPCRGDEVCEGTACIPWTEAALFADFTLEQGADRRVTVRVLPGGFPRTQVDSLRFTFGDGIAGFAETVRHQYGAPGVYPVELEVRLRGHRILRASKLAVIDPVAGHNPLRLTINDLPDYLSGIELLPRNGGTPEDPTDDTVEPFHVLVPTHGFEVLVELHDTPEDPVDRASLSLTSSVAFGDLPAGSELADQLVWPASGIARGRWLVPPASAIPEGLLSLRLRATAPSGAHERVLAFEAIAMPPERDPGDRPMIWLFRTDRDFFTTTARETPAGLELASTRAANGTPDLQEELRIIGAQGPSPEVDALYLGLLQREIRADVYRYFGIAPDGTPQDGIALAIVWQGEPSAPDPAAFRADGDFSMMRFGGVLDGAVGRSSFGTYAEARIDDSTANLGIATAALLSIFSSTAGVSRALAPIRPGTGVPVGMDPNDATVLADDYDRWGDTDVARAARHDVLARIARYIALAIASVTAHEMGHAMGLMPNGVPPLGFFGDVHDVAFIGATRTDSHHADFPGLNLMQAGGDYLGVVDEALATIELPPGADLVEMAEILALENRLSPYARAYLQRRQTYLAF